MIKVALFTIVSLLITHTSIASEANTEGKTQEEILGVNLEGKTPEEILGVTAEMSDVEVTKQYRRAMQFYHPDKQPEGSSKNTEYTEISKKLSGAYEEIQKQSNNFNQEVYDTSPMGKTNTSQNNGEGEVALRKNPFSFQLLNIYEAIDGAKGFILNVRGASDSADFYWVPDRGRKIHQIFLGGPVNKSWNGSYYSEFISSFLDPQKPGGFSEFIIERNDPYTLKAGEFKFSRHSPMTVNDDFLLNLYKKGYREPKQPTKLNLMDYYVFIVDSLGTKASPYYLAVAMTHTKMDYQLFAKDTEVKLFVGTEKSMAEYVAKYDVNRSAVVANGQVIEFYDSQSRRALYDAPSDTFYGWINEGSTVADFTIKGPTGAEILHARPLTHQEYESFNPAIVLGELAPIPTQLKTPSDNFFRETVKQPSGRQQAASLFGAPVNVKTDKKQLTPDKPHSKAVGTSCERFFK